MSELWRGRRVASTNQGLDFGHVKFSVTSGRKHIQYDELIQEFS